MVVSELPPKVLVRGGRDDPVSNPWGVRSRLRAAIPKTTSRRYSGLDVARDFQPGALSFSEQRARRHSVGEEYQVELKAQCGRPCRGAMPMY